MATAKGTKRATAPAAPAEDLDAEIGWTLRMPRRLANRIKALAAKLSARPGMGKFTGNMVALQALERGLDALEGESDQ